LQQLICAPAACYSSCESNGDTRLLLLLLLLLRTDDADSAALTTDSVL